MKANSLKQRCLALRYDLLECFALLVMECCYSLVKECCYMKNQNFREHCVERHIFKNTVA